MEFGLWSYSRWVSYGTDCQVTASPKGRPGSSPSLQPLLRSIVDGVPSSPF